MVYGRVILNLDIQLSNKYFEKYYSKYSMKRSVEQQEDNEHILKLTQRCVVSECHMCMLSVG